MTTTTRSRGSVVKLVGQPEKDRLSPSAPPAWSSEASQRPISPPISLLITSFLTGKSCCTVRSTFTGRREVGSPVSQRLSQYTLPRYRCEPVKSRAGRRGVFHTSALRIRRDIHQQGRRRAGPLGGSS